MRVVVASGNRHKVAELRDMIGRAVPGAEVLSMKELGEPPEVEESADSFAGNATLKAQGIAAWLRALGEPGATLVLADDSGICVDALDGAPGVHSARFAGEPSDDAANNARLARELTTRGLSRSGARYECVLALVRVDGQPIAGSTVRQFFGRWPVEVRVEARGDGGFGYDPHAWLPGHDRTVAELEPEEKARLSHRGAAMAELVAFFQGSGVALGPT